MFTDLRQTNVGRTLVGGLIVCQSIQRTPVVTCMYLHVVNSGIVRQLTVIGITEPLIITQKKNRQGYQIITLMTNEKVIKKKIISGIRYFRSCLGKISSIIELINSTITPFSPG